MAHDLLIFDYPPPGSRLTMVFWGILVPCVIGFFSIDAWLAQEAYWPGGRGGGGIVVRGEAAQACAVAYAGLGAFIHFRWFWGLKQYHRIYQIGAIVSLLGFLGGAGYACYMMM